MKKPKAPKPTPKPAPKPLFDDEMKKALKEIIERGRKGKSNGRIQKTPTSQNQQ